MTAKGGRDLDRALRVQQADLIRQQELVIRNLKEANAAHRRDARLLKDALMVLLRAIDGI